MKIPIEISARHIHLSKKDLEKLFGKNYKLKILKKLSQPSQFASKEMVTLLNKNNKIENVRISGPLRKKSQVEISLTDAYELNLNPLPQIRVSGNLFNTPKLKVQSPKETIKINCMIAKRHIHLSEEEAKKFKLKNNQKVKVKIKGKRALIFDEVIIRVNKNFKSAFHIDTDEANAAGILKKCFGEIIK